MIHGCTTFSTADLGQSNTHLYGKFKEGKNVFECELYYENEEEGVTEIKVRDGITRDIKTSKLYDLQHSERKLW